MCELQSHQLSVNALSISNIILHFDKYAPLLAKFISRPPTSVDGFIDQNCLHERQSISRFMVKTICVKKYLLNISYNAVVSECDYSIITCPNDGSHWISLIMSNLLHLSANQMFHIVLYIHGFLICFMILIDYQRLGISPNFNVMKEGTTCLQLQNNDRAE